MNQSQICIHR